MDNNEQLLQRLRDVSSRREAFAEMVRTYSPALYVQIRRIVQWHDDTDDVLQNTFLKAWTHLDNFRGDAQLSTWLYRIAMNESITFLQKRRQTDTLTEGDTADVAGLSGDIYFDGDRAERLLQEAVASLPEKQRVVFCMKYFDEMKYDEMSAILGTSVGALKASYHIAVKKIETYFNTVR